MEQVAKHNTADDAWLVVEDRVYDMTSFVPSHPGGVALLSFAGRDATDPFHAYHPEFVKHMLAAHLVGSVAPQRTSAFARDKDALRLQVSRTLMTTDWSFYVPTLLTPWLFLIASLLCVFLSNHVAVHALGALCLALFWHQSAWIGHDTCHNSIFKGRRNSHLFGVIYGNLMTGISAGWWKYTHNMHHVTTNEWDKDPDVTHMPLLAVTEKMFLDARARTLSQNEITMLKILIPYQHLLYIPIMIFARFNLYVQSIVFVASGRVLSMPTQSMKFDRDVERGEVIGLIGYWLWFGALLTFGFDSWQRSLMFLFISHLYMGILHIQITLSHWERPFALPSESEHEWMRIQATTSRNIDSNWFNDWYFGGLHYQIEHHLFPRVPRHNLGKLKELVVPFCKRHSIPYCSSGFFEGVKEVLASLSDVALQVKLFEQRESMKAECAANVEAAVIAGASVVDVEKTSATQTPTPTPTPTPSMANSPQRVPASPTSRKARRVVNND